MGSKLKKDPSQWSPEEYNDAKALYDSRGDNADPRYEELGRGIYTYQQSNADTVQPEFPDADQPNGEYPDLGEPAVPDPEPDGDADDVQTKTPRELELEARVAELEAQGGQQPQEQEAPGIWDRAKSFVQGFEPYMHPIDSAIETWKHPSETLNDAGVGASAGFTGHFDDELAPKITIEGGKRGDDGVRREYASGSADRDMRDMMRGEDKEAQQRSPWAYLGGEIFGMTPRTILEEKALGPTGTLALEGALNTVGASESEDPDDLIKEGALGATTSVLGGKLIGGLAEQVPKVLNWGANKLGTKSQRAAQDAIDLGMRQKGARTADIGELRDKAGGLERYHEGAKANNIGQGLETVDEVLEQSTAAQKAANARKNDIANQIDSTGDGVDPRKVSRRIRALKAAQGQTIGKPLAEQLERSAQEFDAMRQPGYRINAKVPSNELVTQETINTSIEPGIEGSSVRPMQRGQAGRFQRTPDMPLDVDVVDYAPDIDLPISVPPENPSWGAMNLERQKWGDHTNFASDSPQQMVRADVYNALNRGMGAQAEASLPGAGKAWRAANEAEHNAITFRDLAQKQVDRNTTNRQITPTDQLSMIGGLVGTAATGLATGNPLMAAAVPAAAWGANRFIRGREHALGAAANRGLSSAYGGAAKRFGAGAQRAQAAMPAVRTAQATQMASAAPRATQAVSGMGMGLSPAMAQQDQQQSQPQFQPPPQRPIYHPPPQQQPQPIQQTQQSQLPRQPQRQQQPVKKTTPVSTEFIAREMIVRNPQALGSYAEPIAMAVDAEKQGKANAVRDLIIDLSNKDEYFKARILPKLSGGANQ